MSEISEALEDLVAETLSVLAVRVREWLRPSCRRVVARMICPHGQKISRCGEAADFGCRMGYCPGCCRGGFCGCGGPDGDEDDAGPEVLSPPGRPKRKERVWS